MNKRRIAGPIIEIIIGIVLSVCNLLDLVDEYWSGMGFALIFLGVIQLVKRIKYLTNADYKDKIEVEYNDERNKFLSTKAWSWAGYIFVLIAAVASVAFKIAGYDELVYFASGSVCLIVTLYWLSYVILERKY